MVKWGYSLTVCIGYIITIVSGYQSISFDDKILLMNILMNGFKVYSTVATIFTFDTIYGDITIHLIVMLKQFSTIENMEARLEFASCIREQFELIQSGFGFYLLSQLPFLTLNFILQTYDLLIQWMVDINNSYFSLYQAALVIILLANLVKMVMIVYCAVWLLLVLV